MELNSVLYDNLKEWDGGEVGGRFKRVGIYIYIADSHCCTVETSTIL